MKPTVTELLKLLDKPQLLKWANKIGLDGVSLDEYRRQSTTKGTSIHNQIEYYNKFKTPFEDKEAQARYDFLMKDKKVLKFEEVLEGDLFKGRMDIQLDYMGKIYNCDFKSSSGIYLENVLQLTAYKMIAPCDFIAVIQIPEMIFKPIYSIQDFTPYENILRALTSIYKNKLNINPNGY